MPRYLILFSVLALTFSGCGGDEDGGGIAFKTGVMHQILEGNGSQPSWSPDGNTIVYVAAGSSDTQDLWMVTPDDGEPAALLAQAGGDVTPRWNPDPLKREIVFINKNVSTNVHTIYTLAVDGGEPQEVWHISQEIGYASYTSDGSKIVFIGTGTKAVLYMVPVEGGDPVEIQNTDGWGKVVSAECSPTEDKIAFIQSKDNVLNIYTISTEGGAPDKLTNFTPGGTGYILTGQLYFLSFAREGDKVVFCHSSCFNCNSSALYFLPVAGGDLVQVTEDPRTASAAPMITSPSMGPGGKKIVAQQNSTLWIFEITKL